MARRYDQLLVIDLEATCWDGPHPDGQSNEIIQLGICTIDLAACERVEKASIFVRPERSTISPFCTTLTGIDNATLDAEGAVSLADACRTLKSQFRSLERVWASWGDYDRRQFERECGEKGIAYPFGRTHLNVKSLFTLARGLNKEMGMAEALALLGRPLEGRHHRADDDAWNIAGVLCELLSRFRRACG
jgi:inhibitor of KinA sporulation pathway (predicted exonuclease)